jgi:hypothetical protein
MINDVKPQLNKFHARERASVHHKYFYIDSKRETLLGISGCPLPRSLRSHRRHWRQLASYTSCTDSRRAIKRFVDLRFPQPSAQLSDIVKAMHEGVIRDMEQQRIKRERALDFEMQRRLEEEYRKVQTVSDGRNS